MSYTPTEWVTGDIVTAEKLNKLENAVANMEQSGPLIVKASGDGTREVDGIYTTISVRTNITTDQIEAAFTVGTVKPVYVLIPSYSISENASPYYSYSTPAKNVMAICSDFNWNHDAVASESSDGEVSFGADENGNVTLIATFASLS